MAINGTTMCSTKRKLSDISIEYRETNPYKLETMTEIMEDIMRTSPDGICNISIEESGDYDAVLSFFVTSFAPSDLVNIYGKTKGISVTPVDSRFIVEITIGDFYMDKPI